MVILMSRIDLYTPPAKTLAQYERGTDYCELAYLVPKVRRS
jgi:hypothetical protein